jgi:hypothetical protein
MLHRKLPCSVSVATGWTKLSGTVGIQPVALPVARHTFLGSAQPPSSSIIAAVLGVNTKPIIGGRLMWKEAKAAPFKRRQPERRLESGATGRPAAPKPVGAGPSAEQQSLGPGWNHVVQGCRVVKATVQTPF